mmetsp:Transcript_23363/g.41876  ORF Transcript_23363/g.41876 Transcript_23363/m.41876 type:complete len:473 (-) Transcript_23363:871-2289(-)
MSGSTGYINLRPGTILDGSQSLSPLAVHGTHLRILNGHFESAVRLEEGADLSDRLRYFLAGSRQFDSRAPPSDVQLTPGGVLQRTNGLEAWSVHEVDGIARSQFEDILDLPERGIVTHGEGGGDVVGRAYNHECPRVDIGIDADACGFLGSTDVCPSPADHSLDSVGSPGNTFLRLVRLTLFVDGKDCPCLDESVLNTILGTRNGEEVRNAVQMEAGAGDILEVLDGGSSPPDENKWIVSSRDDDGGLTGFFVNRLVRQKGGIGQGFLSGSIHLGLLFGPRGDNLLPFLHHGHGLPLFRRRGGRFDEDRACGFFESATCILLLLALTLLLLSSSRRGCLLTVAVDGRNRSSVLFGLRLDLCLFLLLFHRLCRQCCLHRRIIFLLASQCLGLRSSFSGRNHLGRRLFFGLGLFFLSLQRANAIPFLVGSDALGRVGGTLALGPRLDAPEIEVVVGFVIIVICEDYLFGLIGCG